MSREYYRAAWKAFEEARAPAWEAYGELIVLRRAMLGGQLYFDGN